MVSPGNADRLLTSMRHGSCDETERNKNVERIMRAVRHVSVFDTEPEPEHEPEPEPKPELKRIDVERILTFIRHVSIFDTEPEPEPEPKPEPELERIDVERVMRAVRHVSVFDDEPEPEPIDARAVRHIGYLGEDLDEPVGAAFYGSSATGDVLAQSMDEYEHSSGYYSDNHADSSWGPEWEGEKEVEGEISPEDPDSSQNSGEEANDEIGSPEEEYECSARISMPGGVLHLKPSLLKQHMCSDSDNMLFMCPVENCGREYISRGHLHRHSLTHEGNLFDCAWGDCDLTLNVSFNSQRQLKLDVKWGANLLGGSKSPDACAEDRRARMRGRSPDVMPESEEKFEMEDYKFQWGAPRPGSRKRLKLHQV